MQTRSSVFAGAGMHRLLEDWVARLLTPDEEVKRNARALRARARQLGRDCSYCKRYLRLVTANVIGPRGIKLQGRVKNGTSYDEAVNTEIERAWNAWAKKPITIDGRLTLRRVEKLLVRTMAVDGEAFVRIWRGFPDNPFGIALQPIDADMIDDRYHRNAGNGLNEIRMGVEIDEIGRVVGYWVTKKIESQSLGSFRDRYFVPADEMIHVYGMERFNQTRGVTWFTAAMLAAHMLDAYEETEAVAARVAAAKMGFFEQDENSIADDHSSGTEPAIMEANPGSFEFLPKGTRLASWAPDHPSGQFGAFVKQLLRKIATALDVFSNVLANDAEGVTYSTMRSFGLIERDDWRAIQQDFIEMWRHRLYDEWIKTATLTTATRLPSRDFRKYLDVEHVPRGWSWIDPEKEVKAAVLAIQNGLGTRTAALAERGEDIDQVFATLAREKQLAAKYNITIDAEIPAEIPVIESDEDRGGNGLDSDGEPLVRTSTPQSQSAALP